jgi:hypothetical protein
MISLRIRSCTRAAAGLGLLALPAAAQIVNPADKQKGDQQLPEETVVTGQAVSDLREEDRIGPYGQPEWTAHRRFAFVRNYVRPPGTFSFEYWVRPTVPQDSGQTQVRTQYEFEIGLPNRWQLDFYLNENKEGSEGEMGTENAMEFRYALADWGKLWANPTIYGEYKSRDGEADVIEAKLLFGDELSTSWHWGANLVYEREVGGELENVYGFTAGISKTLSDQKFSLGGELKIEMADTHDTRGDFENTFLVGPSMQYRPSSHLHMDVAPLVGFGDDSPALQAIFVIGYEF